jgi:C-terminal processing protease CtpA/Prc
MLGMYVGEEKGYPYPFVLQLDEQSDAKQKGIRTGDELIRFEEEEIRDLPSLFEKATKLRAGREVPLWVRRGSQTLQFRVRVPRNPGAPPATDKDKASEKKSEKPDEKADASADGDKKSKKSKKKGPVVIKPIPTDN